MPKLIIAILLVLLAMYVVPFVVYGGASILGGLRPPTTASPGRFLLGVMLTKLGTAVAFVSIFAVSRTTWGPRWLLAVVPWARRCVANYRGAGSDEAIEQGMQATKPSVLELRS